MRKLLLIPLVLLVFAVPASAAPVVPIVMKDPGCHWFLVGGKMTTKYVSHGAVTIRNLDEAALKVRGPGFTKIEAVGKTLTLKAKGTYLVTMVGQLRHDNILKLIVK